MLTSICIDTSGLRCSWSSCQVITLHVYSCCLRIRDVAARKFSLNCVSVALYLHFFITAVAFLWCYANLFCNCGICAINYMTFIHLFYMTV